MVSARARNGFHGQQSAGGPVAARHCVIHPTPWRILKYAQSGAPERLLLEIWAEASQHRCECPDHGTGKRCTAKATPERPCEQRSSTPTKRSDARTAIVSHISARGLMRTAHSKNQKAQAEKMNACCQNPIGKLLSSPFWEGKYESRIYTGKIPTLNRRMKQFPRSRI